MEKMPFSDGFDTGSESMPEKAPQRRIDREKLPAADLGVTVRKMYADAQMEHERARLREASAPLLKKIQNS